MIERVFETNSDKIEISENIYKSTSIANNSISDKIRIASAEDSNINAEAQFRFEKENEIQKYFSVLIEQNEKNELICLTQLFHILSYEPFDKDQYQFSKDQIIQFVDLFKLKQSFLYIQLISAIVDNDDNLQILFFFTDFLKIFLPLLKRKHQGTTAQYYLYIFYKLLCINEPQSTIPAKLYSKLDEFRELINIPFILELSSTLIQENPNSETMGLWLKCINKLIPSISQPEQFGSLLIDLNNITSIFHTEVIFQNLCKIYIHMIKALPHFVPILINFKPDNPEDPYQSQSSISMISMFIYRCWEKDQPYLYIHVAKLLILLSEYSFYVDFIEPHLIFKLIKKYQTQHLDDLLCVLLGVYSQAKFDVFKAFFQPDCIDDFMNLYVESYSCVKLALMKFFYILSKIISIKNEWIPQFLETPILSFMRDLLDCGSNEALPALKAITLLAPPILASTYQSTFLQILSGEDQNQLYDTLMELEDSIEDEISDLAIQLKQILAPYFAPST